MVGMYQLGGSQLLSLVGGYGNVSNHVNGCFRFVTHVSIT